MTTGSSQLPLRAGAGLAAVLAGWLALDSLRSGVLGSGGSGGLEFFVFWGLPLAAASVVLVWVALRGWNSETRRVVRSGCLGGLLGGGGALAILLVSALVLSWDALRGVVAAVQFTPLACTLGGLAGLGLAGMRKRRP